MIEWRIGRNHRCAASGALELVPTGDDGRRGSVLKAVPMPSADSTLVRSVQSRLRLCKVMARSPVAKLLAAETTARAANTTALLSTGLLNRTPTNSSSGRKKCRLASSRSMTQMIPSQHGQGRACSQCRARVKVSNKEHEVTSTSGLPRRESRLIRARAPQGVE